MSEKIDIQDVSSEKEKNNKAWDELSDFAKLLAKEYFGFNRGEEGAEYIKSQKLDKLKDDMFFIESYEPESDDCLVYALSEKDIVEYIKRNWNNNKFQNTYMEEKILGFKDGELKRYSWKLDSISLVEMPIAQNAK